MEEVVAVEVQLDGGAKRYFMTWGRVQEPVAPAPLEAIVLEHAGKYDLQGTATKARLCGSLQEASEEPYFYEALASMSARLVPEEKRTDDWKREMDRLMRQGKEIYYLGVGPK